MPSTILLDFEKPFAELDAKLNELRVLAESGSDIGDEIARVEERASQALIDLYANLTPWQKTLVARHPQRPHLVDYVNALITEFTPLAGDRKFGDDEALVGGFGRFRGESICVIGQEKGATTEGRLKHNFGMARPEGYRKAARLMEMADRFNIPVLSLVDSAGAYPGIGAEERGQACSSACPTSRSSPARACPAAPSPSPRQAAC
jgi:acetyl-CoA carboxylase carboxyl transferase subunit alpha